MGEDRRVRDARDGLAGALFGETMRDCGHYFAPIPLPTIPIIPRSTISSK